MIVDDSNFMRRALGKILSSEPGFEIVGLISNGQEALDNLNKLDPHVIILDVEMEGMDGLMTLSHIMEQKPTPVIMFSAYTKTGADITLKALQEGAVDFMEKPSGTLSMDLGDVRDRLVKKIRVAVRVTPKRRAAAAGISKKYLPKLKLSNPEGSVLAIGSSTGGVQALHSVIPKLPATLPMPVLIVQHMPSMFTKSLADGLNAESRLTVKEASEGDVLKKGMVYIAPGGLHMTVRKSLDKKVIHLDKNPEGELLRPSVDVMFRSVANVYNKNVLAVILTGMGNDGTAGLRVLRAGGALGLSQDEATCVVYGMPKFAAESGCIDQVLPLNNIASAITAIAEGTHSKT